MSPRPAYLWMATIILVASAVVAESGLGAILAVQGRTVLRGELDPVVLLPDGKVVRLPSLMSDTWAVFAGETDLLVFGVASGTVQVYRTLPAEWFVGWECWLYDPAQSAFVPCAERLTSPDPTSVRPYPWRILTPKRSLMSLVQRSSHQ